MDHGLTMTRVALQALSAARPVGRRERRCGGCSHATARCARTPGEPFGVRRGRRLGTGRGAARNARSGATHPGDRRAPRRARRASSCGRTRKTFESSASTPVVAKHGAPHEALRRWPFPWTVGHKKAQPDGATGSAEAKVAWANRCCPGDRRLPALGRPRGAARRVRQRKPWMSSEHTKTWCRLCARISTKARVGFTSSTSAMLIATAPSCSTRPPGNSVAATPYAATLDSSLEALDATLVALLW